MKTRTLATIAALAGLAFSTVSSAAPWIVKMQGIKGSTQDLAQFKTVDGLKVEISVIEHRGTRSQKPKEIVVVGSKPNS